MSDVGKIILAFRIFTGIHQFTSSKDEKLVEERNNIAPRLMDGENHGAVIIPGQRYQALNDIVGVICIQATCRFVQEENRR